MNQFEIVAAQLVAPGLTITARPGEYVVNFRGGGDDTAYFTGDVDDALDHGRAAAAALPEPASPPSVAVRRRKWSLRPMSAKAERRRFIRHHNRRRRARRSA